MDIVPKGVNGANGCETKPAANLIDEKFEDQSDGEEYSESHRLLPPRQGGMSRKLEKPKRKVQWNDVNGNKLAEVLEYQPSEFSDSDDEDSDSCVCTIM